MGSSSPKMIVINWGLFPKHKGHFNVPEEFEEVFLKIDFMECSLPGVSWMCH